MGKMIWQRSEELEERKRRCRSVRMALALARWLCARFGQAILDTIGLEMDPTRKPGWGPS